MLNRAMCATQIQRINKAHLGRLLLLVGRGGPAVLLGSGSLQHQEAREGQGDAHPPQCDLGLAEDQLAQEGLRGNRKTPPKYSP